MAKSIIQGEVETLARPIIDELELPGKLGLTVTLPPEHAEHIGAAISSMAQCIDAMTAEIYARRMFGRALWYLALFAALIVLAAYYG